MGLEIQIGGDTTDWNKKVKEVERDIKELSEEKKIQIKAGLDTTEINKKIKDAKKSLADLKTTLKDAGNAFSSATPKIASGSNALTQFSRIAQDAPFGIIGIGNNITATAESFGHLVKETGSAGSALKAVASSIMGTGGILLAVSLVTTGLTYMAQNGLTVKDVFAKLSGTFDEFGNSIKKANEEAAKSASGQISSFKAYADAAQDANLPLEQRLIAVKKLRDIAPYYLKDLSDEKILYGDLSGVIANVTTALLAQSRAKAYSSLLDEKAGAQIKLFTEIQEELNTAVQNFEIPIDQVDEFQKAIKGGTGSLLRYLNSVKKAPITPSDFIDFNALENLSQKYKDLGKLNGEAYKLGLKIAAETKTALPLDFTEPPKVKAAKAKVKTPIKKFGGSELDTVGIKAVVKEYEVLENGVIQVAANINTSMKGINVAVDTSTLDLLETLYNFNQDANELIQGGLVNTFNNLGTAIGEALASGKNVFSAIGNSLLQSLGAFISDMGNLLIKYGTLAVAKGVLDSAIATGGPFAVAAGVAAIGVGIALKAAGSAIGAKAKGGTSGSMSTGASYDSPSQSASSAGSSTYGGGTVVFEIEGSKLIGVLNNTLDRNKRLGGNLPIG